MDVNDRNCLQRRSGLLPKGVVELGLDDDGLTAWCRHRGDGVGMVLIELGADQPETTLMNDLVAEHGFRPLLALAAARRLVGEHRRRNTRH